MIYETFVLIIFAMRWVFITKEEALHFLASVAESLLNSTLLHTVVIKAQAVFIHSIKILVPQFSWPVPQRSLLPRVEWQNLTTVHPLLLPL